MLKRLVKFNVEMYVNTKKILNENAKISCKSTWWICPTGAASPKWLNSLFVENPPNWTRGSGTIYEDDISSLTTNCVGRPQNPAFIYFQHNNTKHTTAVKSIHYGRPLWGECLDQPDEGVIHRQKTINSMVRIFNQIWHFLSIWIIYLYWRDWEIILFYWAIVFKWGPQSYFSGAFIFLDLTQLFRYHWNVLLFHIGELFSRRFSPTKRVENVQKRHSHVDEDYQGKQGVCKKYFIDIN